MNLRPRIFYRLFKLTAREGKSVRYAMYFSYGYQSATVTGFHYFSEYCGWDRADNVFRDYIVELFDGSLTISNG